MNVEQSLTSGYGSDKPPGRIALYDGVSCRYGRSTRFMGIEVFDNTMNDGMRD